MLASSATHPHPPTLPHALHPAAGTRPFSAAAVPGYAPVRGTDGEPFPHIRSITYAFSFLRPDDCLRAAAA